MVMSFHFVSVALPPPLGSLHLHLHMFICTEFLFYMKMVLTN